MPKRPWDKRAALADRAKAAFQVPSIEVNGAVFKSDRFYLNSVMYDDNDNDNADNADNDNAATDDMDTTNNTKKKQQPTLSSCTCGAHAPPPLFDREELVKSLELEAAIIGTYTISLKYMAQAFPQLLGPDASVPTLVLHGDKGLSNRLQEEEQKENNGNNKVGQEEETESEGEQRHDDEMSSHHRRQQQQKTLLSEESSSSSRRRSRLNFEMPKFLPLPTTPCKNDRNAEVESSVDEESLQTQQDVGPVSPAVAATPQKRAATTKSTSTNDPIARATALATNFHLTQVQSAWIRPEDPSAVTWDNQDAAPDRRERKLGVHHPKFMILLEKSGDIVVLVTTANLVRPCTTEGSWVQRFQRCKQQPPAKNNNNNNNNKSPPSANDFGLVLTDFLDKVEQAAVPGELTINAFLSRYLNFGLDNLAQQYHFEKAQVHLMPIVPGDYNGDNKKQPFLYGRQRVAHLLSNQKNVISKKDRLIAQPTSFGGKWKRKEMADMVRSYMDGRDNDSDQQVLERMDIVWPSKPYMDTVVAQKYHRQDKPQPPSSDNDLAKNPSPTIQLAGAPFLSSDGFNSCDEPCISRMALYQQSDPPQQKYALVPHIKSMARVSKGSQRQTIEKRCGSAKEYFSWFLLTSACLSHGAQGKPKFEDSQDKERAVSYKNFELGVLFTSRLPERQSGDRAYCFHPQTCSCNASGGGTPSKLIHLPVPFELCPKPYVPDEDDAEFVETPFFHELSVESQCTGNMLLTPYGSNLAKKANAKRKRKHGQA
jgi:hypothetical protein